jgi:chromosome partitioning protein
VDLVIVDTAPHSESASRGAARAADQVRIPCRPAILDLRAIHITVDLVRLAAKRAAIVLTAVPPRGGLADEAGAAVAQYGFPVAPVRIRTARRIHALAHARADGTGV